MSNDASRISVNSSEEAHSSNSASAASETAASAATAGTSGGHHFLRKRHSPGSGTAKKEAIAGHTDNTAAFSKLRKVATSYSKAGNTAQQGTSNDGSSERGAKMGGPSGSSAGASTSNPSGSLHKRSSQLKYLTDYFPDQTSERDFRLTRSRSRATAQLRQDEASQVPSSSSAALSGGSSSTHGYRSYIPVSQEKHSKRNHPQHGAGTSSSAAEFALHRAYQVPNTVRKNDANAALCTASSAGSVDNVGGATSVLQYNTQNTIGANIGQQHEQRMPFGSFSNQAPSDQDMGLLTANTSHPLHFDLSTIAPSVIINLPSSSATTSGSGSTLTAQQQQRNNEISTIASHFAAAVAGNSSNIVSGVDMSQQTLAAGCRTDYMQDPSSGLSSMANSMSAPGSTIGINRPGGGGLQSGSSTKSSSSVFGLRSQQHVNRATSFLGSLVPRMQHLLSSSSGGGTSLGGLNDVGNSGGASGSGGGIGHTHHSSSRIMSIVDGLRSSNEIRQSEAASELAEMLLLGNEESLPNMPVRDIIQCLMMLLQKDHNFELMLTAARCITNMQEALPRALPLITEAIPLLLQKLKRIEYIDVAEQSLIALEVMSRRNAKNILLAGGVAATISHVDFFSLPSQRLSFQIAANCAMHVTYSEFALIKDCLGDLTQRLNFVDDKRCIESICTFFNRLIENLRNHPERLREIAGLNYDFLKNVKQLLMVQPSMLGSNTFLNLLKSMRYMCTKCGDIAVALIKMDFARTLRYLLVGPSDDATFDITSRPTQQMREIIELIGELMPNLPNIKLFEISAVLDHYMNVGGIVNQHLLRMQHPLDVLAVNWYAIDENGDWRLLGANETGLLEQAKGSGEQMAVIEMEGEIYEIDFIRMIRRNPNTGLETGLDRRISSVNNAMLNKVDSLQPNNDVDERDVVKRTKNEIFLELLALLCPLLVEIGTSSTCSSLRFETLKVMMRMIYAVESETQLRKILYEVPLAIYISSTLSNNKNLGVLVAALQLVHILLEKIPHLYVPLLEAEGVFYEIEKLSKMEFRNTSPIKNESSGGVSLRTVSLNQSASGSSAGVPTSSALLLQQQQLYQQNLIRSVPPPAGISAGATSSAAADLSLSSYLAAAAAAVTAASQAHQQAVLLSNGGGFQQQPPPHLQHLLQQQRLLQQHQQQILQQSGGIADSSSLYHHHHMLRQHNQLASSSSAAAAMLPSNTATGVSSNAMALPQQQSSSSASVAAGLSLSTSSRQRHHNQHQQQLINSAALQSGLASLAQSQQQVSPYPQPHSSTLASSLPPPVTSSNSVHQQIAAAAAAAASSLSAQNFFNSTTSSFGAVTSGASLMTSEMLMARANAAFLNPPVSMPMVGQPSIPLFPIASSSSAQQALLNATTAQQHHPHQDISDVLSGAVGLMNSASSIPPAVNTLPNSVAFKQEILERLQEFIHTESQQIVSRYTGENASKYGVRPLNSNVLHLLEKVVRQLAQSNRDVGCEPLTQLKRILLDFEISAFQLNHSGIISALNAYLTDNSPQMLPPRKLRLRRFAAVFMHLTSDHLRPSALTADKLVPFERLIQKVLLGIAQLEQFQVKITNLSGIIQSSGSGGGSSSGSGGVSSMTSTTYLRGAQALRFFQTHQIRCNLKRHPSCKQLREWRHGRGSIKVDPFTLISAIERYLLDRGIGIAPNQTDDSSDNDDISDEEQDLSYSSGASYSGRIELYIGEHKIPSDLSILQAIRQYSLPHDDDMQETIPSSIWITAHTLYYKTAENNSPSSNVDVSSSGTTSLVASTGSGGSSSASSVIRSVVGGSLSRQQPSSSSLHRSSRNAMETISSGGSQLAGTSSGGSSSGLGSGGGGSGSVIVGAGKSSSSTQRKISRIHHKFISGGGNGGEGASGSGTSSISASTSALSSTIAAGSKSTTTSKKDKYSASLTKDSVVFKEGEAPPRPCPLQKYLKNTLDEDIGDSSVNCLVLLRTLYGLSNYWWALFDDEEDMTPPQSHAAILPAHVFYSKKLNLKICRQLSDFLSVATQQIPKWTVDLVRAVPFMFPFTTRRNLLYCTSFGRDRALMHLVNEGTGDDHDSDSTSRLIPRLERKKVSINRSALLKDAQQVMTQLGSSKAMLEVGFEGEVGTGFGPTLEFYTTLSREVQNHSLKLWGGKPNKIEDSDESSNVEYTLSENGLYPSIYRPSSSKQMDVRIKRFEFFGRLLAQALLDSRMLDIPLASTFFKWIIGEEECLGLDDLEVLEPTIFNSLQRISVLDEADFADLETYFVYPGENSFELIKGGKNIPITKENVNKFIELVCYWRLIEGVRPEMEAVRRGFQTVINSNSMKIFFPSEIELLFCGCPESGHSTDKIWSKSALQQAIRPDHGFTHDSMQITWLVEMLNSFNNEKRRKFLQFVTGSPRLPVGGFRALNPPLTVVRKTTSYANNERELPSAMTCYNYLKIPPYETYEMFEERFEMALQFIYSFHLT